MLQKTNKIKTRICQCLVFTSNGDLVRLKNSKDSEITPVHVFYLSRHVYTYKKKLLTFNKHHFTAKQKTDIFAEYELFKVSGHLIFSYSNFNS